MHCCHQRHSAAVEFLGVRRKHIIRAQSRLNVGDCITASGTIDLTDANVEIVDVENLSTPFWFIKPAENATLNVIGKPEAVNLPKGWQISASSSGAKVQKVGFTIYVR